MTTDNETDPVEAKRKRKASRLETVLLAGFVIIVVAAALLYLSASRALDSAATQLKRRSEVVVYLNDDNVWDNCNDNKNREFFVTVSEIIEASIQGDDARAAEASKRLTVIKEQLASIEEPSVCGPPPTPPAEQPDN